MLRTDYPVNVICNMLNISRSTYYYLAVEREEEKLSKAIEDIAGQYPTYGSRRIQHQLKREPYKMEGVGRKRVRRIMREKGLKVRVKKARKQTTNSRHGFPRYENLVLELEVTHPEEVWVCDITYIVLASGEEVYLAIVMDLYTRAIRGWELSRSLGGELSMRALERAMEKGVPEIHHSDQGVQYAASEYVRVLEEAGVKISMAEVGHSEQNAYAERVIRTIKEEEVRMNEYGSYEEARSEIGRFIDVVYYTKRIHSSLGYLTPAEFEEQWRKEQAANSTQNG